MNPFRLLIIVCIFLTGARGVSQITFEHSYNGWAYLVQLENSGYKYCYIDVQNKKFFMHNLDHSLWKQVSLQLPAGYTLMANAYNISENLFSLDGKVCFLYTCYRTTPSVDYESKIMNEDGQVLLSIADCNYGYAYDAGGNTAKLLAYCTDYTSGATTTKVYDLPGSLNTFTAENPIGIRLKGFPNPAGEVINIPLGEPYIGKQLRVDFLDFGGKSRYGECLFSQGEILQIQTPQLPEGIYIVRVLHNEELIFNEKFLIQ